MLIVMANKPKLQFKPYSCFGNTTRSFCIAAVSTTILMLILYCIVWTLNVNSACPKITTTLLFPVPNTENLTDQVKAHEDSSPKSSSRVLMITGSQPAPCENPLGDHFLLRFFKNKVDYSRVHGYDILYNNVLLDPKMGSYWAKIPIIKSAMLAHREAEWIFWVDSDAVFTDMDFEIPFDRYKDHNLVVHGWPNLIYENKSWVSINAGVFLIRNTKWALDFLDVWASMGPKSPEYAKWGKILSSTLSDKMFPNSDDQSSLVYLLLKERHKWGDKIYIENEYSLHGYWVDAITRYNDDVRETRPPFVTHFTGCQPCSGEHNPAYEGDSCRVGMDKALSFSGDQILRRLGYVRNSLSGDGVRSLSDL